MKNLTANITAKVKKADFNAVSFGLIPFLKTVAVLDHLPESIKVKKKTQENTRKKHKKQCGILRSLWLSRNNCCS